MSEAVRVHVRYDTEDENNLTRRERNNRVGYNSPHVNVSPLATYLWEWYWTISGRLRRVRDGIAVPIPASEVVAWCTASGTIIRPDEYAILCAIDEAFCSETNIELRDYRTRQEEEQRIAGSSGGRRR